MKPIVLVHGAWCGAWIWRRVLGPLRAAGHEVHAVTLTGDGERAHLRTPSIGLATHAHDVVALIEAEELGNVLLVGHSYGGLIITAAAQRLLERDAALLSGLVYLDAVMPLPGEAWSSLHPGDVRAQRDALAREHGGALPAVDPSAFGLHGADHSWMQRRCVPHPFGAYHEPVSYDAARFARLPRSYIACTAPAYATVAPHHARVRAMTGWRFIEMPTGHCPMVSMPVELTRILLELAR